LQPATVEMPRNSTSAYLVPFAVFLALLAIQDYVPLPQRTEFALRLVIMTGVLWVFSRQVISFRVEKPIGTIAIGLAVFALWIAPDLLFPGYRSHWLFQNSITGKASGSVAPAGHNDVWLLLFRSVRAIIIVPIVEELFWRGWLMRWLINRDFWKVEFGAYLPSAFWITAALFASEHGPYWDVGLMAGVAYNWWIVRTKSLGDLILAHAITNACLCAYVIAAQKWEYWL
jgi:CAAX prenyl protease-like protein